MEPGSLNWYFEMSIDSYVDLDRWNGMLEEAVGARVELKTNKGK